MLLLFNPNIINTLSATFVLINLSSQLNLRHQGREKGRSECSSLYVCEYNQIDNVRMTRLLYSKTTYFRPNFYHG